MFQESTMSLRERVIEEFQRRFGETPTAVVRAPGRVNLIGEHTDYNDGFVMPMAINRAVWIALRPRLDPYSVVYSCDMDEVAEFSLLEMVHRHNSWAEYIKGVAWALQEQGMTLRGWDGVIAGDVPIGAGLSSSAAVEMAAARAFCHTSGIAWNPVEMAKIGQKTENEWIGVKSGIMDQTISAGGVEDNALLIDCRWLTLTPVPLPPETAVVIMDTMSRRALVGSEYNVRREQCETAAKFFNVPALRDVNPVQLEAVKDLLDDLVYRRARHVVTENARTLAAAEVMRAGDAVQLGVLMNASHASLRDDFEVTNEALNVIVDLAQAQPACYGARMTGGGFGGCAVALVKLSEAETFAAAVSQAYEAKLALKPAIYVSTATDGAAISEGAAV